jgi:hypothetical protein
MAERHTPPRATQVARVQSPVLRTISVEKVGFFCNPASGDTLSSTAIEIIDRLKFAAAKAKVFPHLEARVRVGHGIPHLKDSLSLLLVPYSKDTCNKKIPTHC